MPAVLKKFMDEYKNFYDDDRKKAKDAATKIYDEQEIIANNAYNQAIKDAKISYEDQHRENAIQKLINENEIAEDMANMGLSDSGLNRTQQTAVQLSYANNRAGIERQKQAQLDAFAQNLAAELSSIRQNKTSDIAAIDKEYDSLVDSSTQAAYKVYQEEETKRIKEQNRAIEEQNRAAEANKPYTVTFTGITEIDDSGNKVVIYRDSKGKKITAAPGHNPLTGQNNTKDARAKTYGFFSNGYQPKGIVDRSGVDYGTLSNSGETTTITGKKQNIWYTTKGGVKYWVWSDDENGYTEVVYDSKTDEWIATENKALY